MSFLNLILENGLFLLAAMGKTLELTLLSLVFAAFIGLFFGLLNVSKNKALNVIANIYIDCIRGVPLIVLAFFVYFGIPMATGIRLEALTAGIDGFLAKPFFVSAFKEKIKELPLSGGSSFAYTGSGGDRETPSFRHFLHTCRASRSRTSSEGCP